MATTDIGIRIGLQGAQSVEAGLQRVQAGLGNLGTRVDSVGNALKSLGPALAGVFSVGALVSFVKTTVDGIDAMNDLADATGASIEEISKLDQVARRSGASLDQVSSLLIKFNGVLKDADGKNGASIALNAIGLEAEKLRQLDPAEALRQTAVALEGFADNADKARIVQELFGKSVGNAAPLLKDLAEAGVVNATVTVNQAAEVDKFNKALAGLSANVTDAARSLVLELLPALTQTLNKFNAFSQNGGVLSGFGNLLVSQFKDARVAATLEEINRLEGRLKNANVTGFNRSSIEQELRETTKQLRQLQGEAVKTSAALDKALGRSNAGGGRGSVNPALAVQPPSVGDIAAEQARAKAAELSTVALQKQRQAYDTLRNSIDERVAAGQAELQQASSLSESQKLQTKLNADYAAGLVKLTPAQKAVLDARLADLGAIEQQVQAEKDATKAATEAAKARSDFRREEERAIQDYQERQAAATAASLAGVNQRIDDLKAEAAAAELAAGLNISLAEAIELVTLNRLSEKQAQYTKGSEPYLAVEREIQARRELAGLIASKENASANAEAAKDAADDWKKASDQINQSLTDALMRAFESGKGFFDTLWQSIKNTLKTTVLRAIIQPIVGGVTGSIGGSNPLSSLGSISNLSTLGSTLTNGVTTTVANAIGTAGTTFGSAALTSFSAGMKGAVLAPGLAGPTTVGASGATGLGASFAVAAPYVLAALAVLNVMGAFRSKKIVGGGLMGTLGEGDIQNYDLQRRGGTLLDGPSYSLVNQRISAESEAIQTAYQALRTNAANMAEALGLSGDAVRNFTTRLGNDVLQNDLSKRGIKLDGLSPEQAATKVQQALNDADEDLAALVLGTKRAVTETVKDVIGYQVINDELVSIERAREVTRLIDTGAQSFERAGETSVQTLNRLLQSLTGVNPVLETIGIGLFDTSLAGADLASQFADLFGGLQGFGQIAASYYNEFFTEAERNAKSTQQLTETLGGLSLALPATREQYRALVEAQDLSTESGRRNAAALISLSGVFGQVTDAADQAANDLAEAANDLAEAAAQIAQKLAETLAQLASERDSLSVSLLRAQGDTSGAAALLRDQSITSLTAGMSAEDSAAVIAALDYNDALREQIATLEAATQATQNAKQAELQLAQFVADQRASLQDQLDRLSLTNAEILAKQRSALDESNRSLFDQINALQATQDAAEAAAQAEQNLAAERNRIASERSGLERELLQLNGDTAAIRLLERNALDESNRALYDQITALQDSQAAAEAASRASAEAAQAAAEAARQQEELANAIAAAGRKVSEEILRLRGAATGGTVDEARLRAQFAITTAQARSGNLDALNALPELTAAIEASALLSAGSTIELNKIRALLAASLSDTLTARGIALPGLATGTNYVPADMIAQLHEGEAVVPRAYNPAAGAGQGAMVTELRALRFEVEGLRAEARATAVSSNKTARLLERVTLDGEAMQTVAA